MTHTKTNTQNNTKHNPKMNQTHTTTRRREDQSSIENEILLQCQVHNMNKEYGLLLYTYYDLIF